MKPQDLDNLKNKLLGLPGIHSKEEYFNTAVLVLFMLIDGEYHFVFEKRSPGLPQGGEICFPGGGHDPEKDANYEQTAIRETVEEIGIPADKIKVLGALDTLVAPMGATIDAFVGVAEIDSLNKVAINKQEVEKAFTMPVSFFEQYEPQKYQALVKIHPSYIDEKTGEEIILLPAARLGLPERYTRPWGEHRYSIYVYQTEQGLIWGITARLVYDIVKKLKT